MDSQGPGLTLGAPEFSSRPGSSSSHLSLLFLSLPFSFLIISIFYPPILSFCEGLSCSLGWLQSHALPTPASLVHILSHISRHVLSHKKRLYSRWKSHRNPKGVPSDEGSVNQTARVKTCVSEKNFRWKRVGQRVSRIIFGKYEESEGGKLNRRVS